MRRRVGAQFVAAVAREDEWVCASTKPGTTESAAPVDDARCPARDASEAGHLRVSAGEQDAFPVGRDRAVLDDRQVALIGSRTRAPPAQVISWRMWRMTQHQA